MRLALALAEQDVGRLHVAVHDAGAVRRRQGERDLSGQGESGLERHRATGQPGTEVTARHQVATPVNWKAGDDVIIVPAVSDEAAREKYPEGWKTLKPYLRIVPQPRA